MLKRGIALLLCLFLLFPSLPGAHTTGAWHTFTGGGHTYFRSHTYTPAAMTQYTVNTMRHRNAGQNEEHILSYVPSAGLRPVVVGPDRIHSGAMTINEAATRLRNQGYDVVAGVNGGFFNTANMTLIGTQIKQGVLTTFDRETQQYLPAAGFKDNGEVVLGLPGISISVTGAGRTVQVDKLNKVRNPDLVYMYTRDYSTTTRTTQDGLHVVMRVPGRLTLGGTLTGTVTQVRRGTAAHTIANDEIVLSASTQNAISRISHLTVGSAVTISVGRNAEWAGVTNAVVGLHFLVQNGQPTGVSDGARAPRTVIGVRADGSVVIFTVDGRQPGHSIGLTLNETAARMIDMGCVTAVQLDNGGSTAMIARLPGEQAATLVNRPSDGSPRRCADFIMLCNVFPRSDGRAAFLFPHPTYLTMMPLAAVSFSMLATDLYYRSAAVPGGISSSSANPEVGRANGLSFSALSPGDTAVTFQSGAASGTAYIHVTNRLDSFTLTDAATGLAAADFTAVPGRSVRFAAEGRLNNAPVLSSARSFGWAAEGGIGTITADGVFTASAEIGKTGRIVVTGGGLTAVLNVRVGEEPRIIADAENAFGALSPSSGDFTPEIVTDPNLAERGTAAAALTYAFPPAAHAARTVWLNAQMPGRPPFIHFLVTGDNSGHELYMNVIAANGTPRPVFLGRLDFTGVRTLSAELPPQTTAVTGLTLISTNTNRLNGTFYLHQIVTSWEATLPNRPPSVTIDGPREDGSELVYTLTAADWRGRRPDEVAVHMNGNALPSPVWNAGRTEIRVPLPASGLHILSVDAADALGRRTRQISTAVFGSAGDKWYTGYVDFLDERGVIDTREGTYNPEQPATRLEIARMLYRILKPPAGQSALPFDDVAALYADDLAAVRALYDAGVFSGKVRADGTLYFDPDGLFTRAELFTVISKGFAGGYERADLSRFADAARVPAYALRSAQILVGMGVVSGSGGWLLPNNLVSRAEVCALFVQIFY
jgi:hypothetical protein